MASVTPDPEMLSALQQVLGSIGSSAANIGSGAAPIEGAVGQFIKDPLTGGWIKSSAAQVAPALGAQKMAGAVKGSAAKGLATKKLRASLKQVAPGDEMYDFLTRPLAGTPRTMSDARLMPTTANLQGAEAAMMRNTGMVNLARPALPAAGYGPGLPAAIPNMVMPPVAAPTSVLGAAQAPLAASNMAPGASQLSLFGGPVTTGTGSPFAAGAASAPASIANAGVATQQALPFAASSAAPTVTGAPSLASAMAGGASPIAQAAPAVASATNPFARLATLSNWTSPTANGAARATGRGAFLSYGPNAVAEAGGTVGRFAPGTLGRASIYGLGGQIAGGALEKVWNDPNSSADNAAVTALKMGGLGAGIGTMILPGVGTAVGGALGAVGGGLWGALRGGHAKDDFEKTFNGERQKLIASATAMGLNGENITALTKQFDSAAQMSKAVNGNNPNKDALKMYSAQLLGMMPAAQQQQQTLSDATTRAIATQAQIGEYMKPYVSDLQAQYDTNAKTYEALAEKYKGQPYEAQMRASADQSRLQGARYAEAYTKQAQMYPQMYAENLVQQYRQSQGQPYSTLMQNQFQPFDPSVLMAQQAK